MQLKYTPQRSERKVEYELNDNILSITENDETIEVDLDELREQMNSEELYEHSYPILNVTDDSVTVIRFYSEDEKELFEKK
mgnify:CR=1 FL=1